MEISGSYTFDASPERVWALLMDPAVISSCIPGCDRFEPSGENRYRVTLTVALIVDVAGTVQTGGPIARLGQRLIGGVSKMMLDRFFACLQGKLTSAADQ